MISQLTLELQKATRTRDQLGTKLGLTKSMLSESQKRREHLEAEVAEKEKTLCQKERELQELQVQLDIILYTTDK